MKKLFRIFIFIFSILEAAGQNVSPDIRDKDQKSEFTGIDCSNVEDRTETKECPGKLEYIYCRFYAVNVCFLTPMTVFESME
jgi:hypothetical protein